MEEYSYDVAIIYVGVNDILRSKHYDKLDKLSGNIIKVGRTSIDVFDINKKLRDLCIKYNFEFIVNQLITTKVLWNDGIHFIY